MSSVVGAGIIEGDNLRQVRRVGEPCDQVMKEDAADRHFGPAGFLWTRSSFSVWEVYLPL